MTAEDICGEFAEGYCGPPAAAISEADAVVGTESDVFDLGVVEKKLAILFALDVEGRRWMLFSLVIETEVAEEALEEVEKILLLRLGMANVEG